MTKTTFRFFFHFSFPVLKLQSFTPTAFMANLCNYEFSHFFNINASNNASVICHVVFLVMNMSRGTETNLEPTLDFNQSTKTTEW